MPKPDGPVRFCVDYRHVNEVTLFAYPVPWVDALLDKIGGAQVLSTLEITKGY